VKGEGRRVKSEEKTSMNRFSLPLIVTQSYQQSVLEDLSKVSKELIVDNSAA
jgi:hypothetical protein